MEEYLKEDYEVHSDYDREVPLNLVINSKGEIITAHRNYICFYSNELYNLLFKINIKNEIIKDILLINDNDLILATENGKLIRYKKDDDYQFSKYKGKIINKDINFRHIIALNDKNLICAFSLNNIYIIDINSFSINFNFSLPKELSMDPRTKPFIISKKKNRICFRHQKSLSIFDYKKMKIIKTVDLSKNTPFQLYKDEKENFLYLTSIVLKERKNKDYFDKFISYIETIKYDLDLNVIEKSKIKINMPYCNEEEFVEEEEEEEKEKYNYLNPSDHYCIYRSIVQNVKNYSFILHGYRGPPFEAEWFWIVECKNGKIKKIEQKAYQYLSSDSSNVDCVFIKNKGKIISAFIDKDDINFD